MNPTPSLTVHGIHHLLLCILTLLMLGASTYAVELTGRVASLDDRLTTLIQKRQFESVIAILEVTVKQEPRNFPRRCQLMYWYTIAGKTNQAKQLVFDTLKYYPKTNEALYLRAYSVAGPVVGQGNPSDDEKRANAIRPLVDTMRQIDDVNANTRYVEGMLALFEQDIPDAEQQLLRALYQSPYHLWTLHALANLYLSQGNKKRALTYALQAYDSDSSNVDTLYLLGRLYLENEDPEKALIYLQKSQAVDPSERPLRILWMSKAYEQLGQQEQAQQLAQQAQAAWPNANTTSTPQSTNTGNLPDTLNTTETASTLNPAELTASKFIWSSQIDFGAAAYTTLLQENPNRADILYLVTLLRYHQWQLGDTPSDGIISDLESRIFQQQQQGVSRWLQLADVQLQAIRNNELSPELRQVIADIVANTDSSLLKAEGYLLMRCPASAQALYNNQALEALKPHDLEELATMGAFPWLIALNKNTEGTTAELTQWIANYSKLQQAQSLKQRQASLKLLNNGSANQAISGLKEAQLIDPLNADTYLGLAKAAILTNRIKLAQQNLAVANQLALSKQQRLQLFTLEKTFKDRYPDEATVFETNGCPTI